MKRKPGWHFAMTIATYTAMAYFASGMDATKSLWTVAGMVAGMVAIYINEELPA